MKLINRLKRIWYRINPTLEDAVDEAVRYCIDHGILKDVFEEERSAVMLEMLTEFDEKLYEEGLREEAMEEGFEQGMAQGMAQGIKQGFEQGIAQGIKQGMAQGIKQGMAQERANTEAERERADKAEAERDKALAELAEYKSGRRES